MSEYLVTARKWRPMKFEDVVGQDHVTVTLRNAIAAGRLAHAYLFSGPRGVGKTTTARILARAVNCVSPEASNPDNTCNICREITEGRSFDVLEIDGASNRGVEEIRNLRESVRYAPTQGKYKVYIIDEVHMLTKEAFNALLKTLEEPPPHVLFIFATTEIHKVPATIVSRCQRFDFRRITVDEIITNLRAIAGDEGIAIDDDSLLIVAKKGDGSLRDAQSIFDQVVSLCGRTISGGQLLDALHIVDTELFFRVTDLVKTGDARGGLQLVDELMGRGYDLREFLAGLTEHLRNILIALTTNGTSLIEASDHYRKRYQQEAASFSIADLLRLLRQVTAAESAIRWSMQPRFRLEADLVQLITTRTAPEVGEVLQQIEELKKKLSELRSSPTLPGAQRSFAPAATTGRIPPPQQRAGAGAQAAPPQDPGSAGKAAPEEEVRARWPEFVAEARRERVSLGPVLEGVSILGVDGMVIRITCADDYQASTLKRNREVLVTTARHVFGAPMRLEMESPGTTRPAAPPQPEPQQEPAPREEHPVVKAIVRELGAEPVQ